MPYAVACGLTANMSKNSILGVLSIDLQGNKIGHPTPVSIDAIRAIRCGIFNRQRYTV